MAPTGRSFDMYRGEKWISGWKRHRLGLDVHRSKNYIIPGKDMYKNEKCTIQGWKSPAVLVSQGNCQRLESNAALRKTLFLSEKSAAAERALSILKSIPFR